MIKALCIALLAVGAQARLNEPAEESLLLEVVVEGGRRELFPLLPGTKCPAGHHCRAHADTAAAAAARARRGAKSPMMALRDNLRTGLEVQGEHALNNEFTTVVQSQDHCTRRNAMARAAGLLSGLSLATVNAPAFAAETKTVQLGSDTGQLVFVPASVKICKGDTVEWINNKGGPHNVVFDEDGIPAGVSQEKISMDSQLGEEGEKFSMSFDVAGNYDYYCEPHRGAGMNGKLVVA